MPGADIGDQRVDVGKVSHPDDAVSEEFAVIRRKNGMPGILPHGGDGGGDVAVKFKERARRADGGGADEAEIHSVAGDALAYGVSEKGMGALLQPAVGLVQVLV